MNKIIPARNGSSNGRPNAWAESLNATKPKTPPTRSAGTKSSSQDRRNGEQTGGGNAQTGPRPRTTKEKQSEPAVHNGNLSDATFVITVGKKKVVIKVDQLGAAFAGGEPRENTYEAGLIAQLRRCRQEPLVDFSQFDGLDRDDKLHVLGFLIRASQDEQGPDSSLTYLAGRPPVSHKSLFDAVLANLVGPADMARCAEALSMLTEVTGQLPADLQDVAISRTRDRLKELKVESSLMTATAKSIKASSKKPPRSEAVSVAKALGDERIDPALYVPAGWRLTRDGVGRPTETGSNLVIPRPVFISEWQSSVNEGGEESVTVSFLDCFVEEARRPGSGFALLKMVSKCVPRYMLATTKTITELASFGFPITSLNAPDAVQYLADYERENRGNVARSVAGDQLGWQGRDGELGFLLGGEHILESEPPLEAADEPPDEIDQELLDEDRRGQQLEWRKAHPKVVFRGSSEGDRQIAAAFTTAGTLEGWRHAMRFIEHHPPMQLAVYSSLSAPLINIVGGHNFWLDYCGLSTTGKTTALRGAASVFGYPGDDPGRPSLLRSCDSTRVGAERTMAVLSDLPSVIDETKLADSSEIRRLIFAAHGGRGRTRGAVAGLAATSAFRTVVVSSGEEAVVARNVADGGDKVRVITHWGPTCGPENSETAKAIRIFTAELDQHHGHAGRRFLQFLVDNRQRWKSWREAFQASREKYRRKAGTNTFAIRLGNYFAVIDVAASIAHELELLPFQFHDPIDALWDVLIAEANAANRPLEALRHTVSWAHMHEAEFEGRRRAGFAPPIGGLAGFWNKDGGYHTWKLMCFHPPRLTSLLKDAGFDADTILRSWKVREWLKCDAGKGVNSRRTYTLTRGKTKHRVYAITRQAVELASEDVPADREAAKSSQQA